MFYWDLPDTSSSFSNASCKKKMCRIFMALSELLEEAEMVFNQNLKKKKKTKKTGKLLSEALTRGSGWFCKDC